MHLVDIDTSIVVDDENDVPHKNTRCRNGVETDEHLLETPLRNVHTHILQMHPGETILPDSDIVAERSSSQDGQEGGDLKEVLVTWLNAEIKLKLQRIDRKLGDLVSLASRNTMIRGCSDEMHEMSSANVLGTCSQDVERTSRWSGRSSESDARYTAFHTIEEAQAAKESRKVAKVARSEEDASTENTRPSFFSRLYSRAPVRVSGRSNSTARTRVQTIQQIRTALVGLTTVRESRKERGRKLQRIQKTIIIHQNPHGQLATSIWRFFENRYSSTLATVYATFAPLLVFCSALIAFWQTLESCPFEGSFGEVLNICFEGLFALELVLRCYGCPDRCDFWCDPFNYIDAFSVCPLFIRIVDGILSASKDGAGAEDVLFGVDMILPALRLLRLARRFEKFKVLLSAFIIALEALPVLLYTLLVIALVFSALIFYAEESENMDTLAQSLWFVFVTMSTVGYGDISPKTTLGTFFTSLLIIVSGLYVAMPIGIVGDAFSKAWSARDRLLLMTRMREAFLQQGFAAHSMKDIVSLFDQDSDGELSLDEFNEMLETMRIRISQERIRTLFQDLDKTENGKIGVDELMHGLFPRKYKGLSWTSERHSF